MAVYHASRQRQGPLGIGGGLLGGAARSAAVSTSAGRRARPGKPEAVASGAGGVAAGALASFAGASLPLGADLPRRRTRVVVRAGRRSDGRVGLVLGGIVVAFLLAFFSLAQTVQVSATGYDIDRLLVERSRLEAQRQELLNDLTRLGREPAIRKGAVSAGLAPLADPLVVPAR